MTLPIDISFQDIPHSKAVEEAVTHQVNHLGRICDQITRCRVSLSLEARHQQQGRPFSVHIGVTMPHHEPISSTASNEDVYVAVRDAFAQVERMVAEAVQKRRPRADQHGNQTAGT